MKPIFTKTFFTLSAHDQVAIVEAALDDIEKNYGRYVTAEDEQRALRQAKRIRQKAVEYGIFSDHNRKKSHE